MQAVKPVEGHDIYSRFSARRKAAVTVVLVWSSLQSTLSTTAVISAIPEVAGAFDTTNTVIAMSNALMILFQVVGPILYAPVANIFGRRPILLIANALITVFSLGTALAPNLVAYFILRFLTAPQVTAAQVIGTVVIGDIYPPLARGRALGWLMLFASLAPRKKVEKFIRLINPSEIIILLVSSRSLAINAVSVASLHWNQYSILTPIREVLSPRFHLSTPLDAGLFYLAPCAGYVTGTYCGGHLSDWVVRRYLRRRGRRVPEDRLNSVAGGLGVAMPVCALVYGWALQQAVGGIPLVVIALFIQGVCQTMAFVSLNAYCIDVMEGTGKSSLAVAGSYMIRNVSGAVGTAACLPGIETIGVGGYMTITAGFLAIAGGLLWLATRYGEGWRGRKQES